MNLDPRTLLFSLILTYGVSVLSMFVAAAGHKDSRARSRDGMGKWAMAMFLQTVAWGLIAARGNIPDLLSITVPNGLIASAFAVMLAAIHEFQQRPTPRWQYLTPVTLALLMAIIEVHQLVKWD